MAPRTLPSPAALPDPIPTGHPVLVTPAADRRVRDPLGAFEVVPAEGKAVAWTAYWARLLAGHDITVAPVPPEPAPEPEQEA